MLILKSQHHILIMFTEDALNPTRKSLDNIRKCLHPVFLPEQPKNFQGGSNLAQKLLRGPTTLKDMLENAWNGIANWQTRRHSNYSRFPVLA